MPHAPGVLKEVVSHGLDQQRLAIAGNTNWQR